MAHWYAICFIPRGPGFKYRQGRELLILNKNEFKGMCIHNDAGYHWKTFIMCNDVIKAIKKMPNIKKIYILNSFKSNRLAKFG